MATSDGIDTYDWGRVKELAIALFHACETEDEQSCRQRLLEYLDELEVKYGLLPSIVATRADFIRDDPKREALLLQAYSLALAINDKKNGLHVAHSLAEFYTEDRRNCPEAKQWLQRLKEHMIDLRDTGDYSRMFRQLKTSGSPDTTDDT